MSLDFTTDINNVTRQIRQYLLRDQPIPKCTLDHYNTLLSINNNSNQSENPDPGPSQGSIPVSSEFPEGTLSTTFTTVSTTNNLILSNNLNRTYVLIQNLGASNLYINFNAAAANNGGLKLSPGSSWSSLFPQFVTANINAISIQTSNTIAIYTLNN